MTRRKTRAIGLMSGGLDSTLAAGLLKEQGVEVEGVHFSTGFCKVDHRRALGRPEDRADPKRLRNEALAAGASLEIPVEIVDVAEEYLREVVLHPRHGYGSAMNPCIDCRIFMLKKASEIARDRGADVIFTGEVIGQRPMSQHKAALRVVEEESGLAGSVLRPLSARHLAPTPVERDGRIDRERLGDFTGRSRTPQIEMAQRMGVEDYPAPSGGCCYLADENFARRFRDLVKHTRREGIGVDDILLLKIGRHFRITGNLKLIAARHEAESRFLEQGADGRWTCQVADGRGAVVRAEGDPDDGQMVQVAALAARYSRHRAEGRVEVRLRRGDEERRVTVRPATDEWARGCMIGVRP
jgi:tRNA U34 2-thiouridine synthase MnmA/TrmU